MKRKDSLGRHRRSANRHLAEHYFYTGDNHIESSIRLITYNSDGVFDQEIKDLNQPVKKLLEKDKVNWLQVSGISDAGLVSSIASEFGLHALDVKDILTPQHIVKLEEYDNKIFIILNTCFYDSENRIQTEHLAILLTQNTIITFTENTHDLFTPTLKAIQEDTFKMRSKDTSFLLAFLLNAVVANFVETSLRVEELLEDIEDILLDISKNQSQVGTLIQQRRREFMVIRKNSQPLRDQFSKLMNTGNLLVSKQSIPAFNDIIDQLQYVNQTMEGCREIITSLVDLYISNNDLRMNAIMKRLTIVSTVFIPLTFLAGIWGMNFKYMPELDWRYGYLAAWGIMLIAGLITWLFLRKKDWY